MRSGPPVGAPPLETSPLSEAEVQQLDATLLPALERHHLRLLAHGLRTLQAIGTDPEALLPTREALEAWTNQQPQLQADPAFAQLLTTQLLVLGRQLEEIAAPLDIPPLALTLDHLIGWADEQARQRVSRQG